MAFIGIFIVMMLGVIVATYIQFIALYAVWLAALSLICFVGAVLIYIGYVHRQSREERVRSSGKVILITGLTLFLLSIAVVTVLLVIFLSSK